MALPILNELNDELTRLYIAGSALAKDDPRVARYIAPLQKLGEKVPVFQALATRLESLVAPDGEKTSPENLMEAGMLLQSVLYTQGETAVGETAPAAYAAQPLSLPGTPYSRLWEMQQILRSGSQAHSDAFRIAYQAGQHKDPRLYWDYVDAVGDNRGYISDYVADVILPSLGEDILPFLMERLDLAGGKRNARLLRVIHAIQGMGAVPLAERALAEGAPHVMAEALYILAEDKTYEETLLSYTRDRKGELRQAAFTALVRMGSLNGRAALLESLKKASVTALEEALCESTDAAVAAAVLEEAKACVGSYKESAAKLKVLLRVLAARDEEEGLAWLEKILADAKFYAEAVNILELNTILHQLGECDSMEKNRLLLRISEGDSSRLYYKILACVRLFDAGEVYSRCHKDIGAQRSSYHTHLMSAYGLDWNRRLPDEQKTWDRRWAALYAKAGNVSAAYMLLYDDDDYGWKHLLEAAAGEIKTRNRYLAQYGGILTQAYRAGYKGADKYYQKFIKNGFPKEKLAEYLEEHAPRS